MNQAEALIGMIEGLKHLGVAVTIRQVIGGMTEVALHRDDDVDVHATGGTTGEALGAALEVRGELAVTAAVVTAAHVGEPVPVVAQVVTGNATNYYERAKREYNVEGLEGWQFLDYLLLAQEAIWRLEKRQNAVPVDALRKLRQMLSDEGEYSILRDDGEPMELGEILMTGIVLEEIDTWLNAQGGAQ